MLSNDLESAAWLIANYCDVQQGNSPAKDLVGKSVFTFGTQKKGDFYVPADRIKVHSQLTVHPSGRITIGFCNAQVIPVLPTSVCIS